MTARSSDLQHYYSHALVCAPLGVSQNAFAIVSEAQLPTGKFLFVIGLSETLDF